VEILIRRVARHRSLVTAACVGLVAVLAGALGANEHARHLRRSEEISFLTRSRAEVPLIELPLSTQLDLRRRLKLLRNEDGVKAAEAEDTMTALEKDFEALQTELKEKGLDDLALARDSKLPDGVREQRRLAAMQTLFQASQLFPEDDELRRLAAAESAFPTISVRALDETGKETSAEVYLCDVDVLTSEVGDARYIGGAPLPPTPLVPGYYRIVVVFAAGGSRELISNMGPAAMEIHLTAKRRADEGDIEQGMVFSAPPTRSHLQGEQPFSGKTITLRPFLLDATEVSNREYNEFLQSTGHPLPRSWQALADLRAFLTTYGDLPVVGVTWSESVAFAEWRGKRLPTAGEWHRAAGGLEGRPFPYSPDPAEPLRGNVQGINEPEAPGFQDAWSEYLHKCRYRLKLPGGSDPQGVYNMFGNVYEYTESMVATRSGQDEIYLIRPYDRWLYGGAWDAKNLDEGMRTPYYQGTGPNDFAYFIGFRCAKSQSPPHQIDSNK
jgi:formylglycine-generating enzyme required for sulfatase activity